jgi:hypothetical protein
MALIGSQNVVLVRNDYTPCLFLVVGCRLGLLRTIGAIGSSEEGAVQPYEQGHLKRTGHSCRRCLQTVLGVEQARGAHGANPRAIWGRVPLDRAPKPRDRQAGHPGARPGSGPRRARHRGPQGRQTRQPGAATVWSAPRPPDRQTRHPATKPGIQSCDKRGTRGKQATNAGPRSATSRALPATRPANQASGRAISGALGASRPPNPAPEAPQAALAATTPPNPASRGAGTCAGFRGPTPSNPLNCTGTKSAGCQTIEAESHRWNQAAAYGRLCRNRGAARLTPQPSPLRPKALRELQRGRLQGQRGSNVSRLHIALHPSIVIRINLEMDAAHEANQCSAVPIHVNASSEW